MTAILSDFLILLVSISVLGFLFYMVYLFLRRILRWTAVRQYDFLKTILVFYLVALPLLAIVFVAGAKSDPAPASGEDLSLYMVIRQPVVYQFYGFYKELDYVPYVFGLWFAGATLLFLFCQWKGSGQLKRLKKSSKENRDRHLETLCKELVEEYRICRPIKIYFSDVISSPFIAGIRKPTIFLPCRQPDRGRRGAELSEQELEFIFRHELIHCKQRDILYKRLLQVGKCLYWFNPSIWFFACSFDDCGELACDELLLEQQSWDRRQEYARCIMRFASYSIMPDQAAGINSRNIVEKRISAIVCMSEGGRKQKRSWRWFLPLAGLVLNIMLLTLANSLILREMLAQRMETIYFQEER